MNCIGQLWVGSGIVLFPPGLESGVREKLLRFCRRSDLLNAVPREQLKHSGQFSHHAALFLPWLPCSGSALDTCLMTTRMTSEPHFSSVCVCLPICHLFCGTQNLAPFYNGLSPLLREDESESPPNPQFVRCCIRRHLLNHLKLRCLDSKR